MVHLEARLAAATAADMADMAVTEVMAAVTVPVERAICAVICGVPIRCASVWEAICAHACK